VSRPSAAISVRTARPADLSALLLLEETCFAGDRIAPRSFRRWLGADRALCLLAEQDRLAVAYGLVLLHHAGRVARLYSLAVAPAARGSGTGARLLDALEAAARARGYAVMRLEVAPGNAAALALYRRAGYRVIGRRRAYYEDGGDALRMEKPLAATDEPP
jgi:ribosomal protein S18 acetylase RimI-like enzyme